MRHLTAADYRTMPWANGRGQTIELLRQDRDGALLYRLSMATVAEDGAFSLLPGVERNLTVIEGPGFDLVGERVLRADPLCPVAFSGGVAIAAAGVTGVSVDFNVMTAQSLPLPEVWAAGPASIAAGGMLCLFALEAGRVDGRAFARHDLLIGPGGFRVEAGRMMAVRLWGLSP